VAASLTKDSKFLSLILRHAPEKADLTLGPGGWVDVDDLLSGIARAGHAMTLERLETIISSSDKKRFTLSDDKLQIRAAQGHSIPVDLELKPATPPDMLYHGTVEKFLPSILETGLKPMKRHHVHLSVDHETATKVGERRGKPIILTVSARKMTDAGHEFFVTDNGVWLTANVPPVYLKQPEGEVT